MKIVALPSFPDNNIRQRHKGQPSNVVDPVDAALDVPGLALAGILVTQHPLNPASVAANCEAAAASGLLHAGKYSF
ncbi:MAG: hypothetical protein EBY28_08420 [Betaproteobacteria bacterium]|nr:hypothetical protein [Betaproteobacteria bacterium]